jgi:hypothetical protein
MRNDKNKNGSVGNQQAQSYDDPRTGCRRHTAAVFFLKWTRFSGGILGLENQIEMKISSSTKPCSPGFGQHVDRVFGCLPPEKHALKQWELQGGPELSAVPFCFGMW